MNNLYNNKRMGVKNKSKYSLLETMKVKDIMGLSSEEKARITRNFSINDSNLLKKDKILQEAKKLNISNRIIDPEPYALHLDTNDHEEVMFDSHKLNKDNIIIENNNNDIDDNGNSNSDNIDKFKKESSSEEERIREIVNSINIYNKNKNRRKLTKCQSAFSDDARIRRYNTSRLAKSYSHVTMDIQREEFFKSLRDFNIRMKNYTKMSNMKKLRLQQNKIFIERLKDLAHYMKFLDRYCNELNAFSNKENENSVVIKEMETFSRSKFKLIRSYIKGIYKYYIYI